MSINYMAVYFPNSSSSSFSSSASSSTSSASTAIVPVAALGANVLLSIKPDSKGGVDLRINNSLAEKHRVAFKMLAGLFDDHKTPFWQALTLKQYFMVAIVQLLENCNADFKFHEAFKVLNNLDHPNVALAHLKPLVDKTPGIDLRKMQLYWNTLNELAQDDTNFPVVIGRGHKLDTPTSLEALKKLIQVTGVCMQGLRKLIVEETQLSNIYHEKAKKRWTFKIPSASGDALLATVAHILGPGCRYIMTKFTDVARAYRKALDENDNPHKQTQDFIESLQRLKKVEPNLRGIKGRLDAIELAFTGFGFLEEGCPPEIDATIQRWQRKQLAIHLKFITDLAQDLEPFNSVETLVVVRDFLVQQKNNLFPPKLLKQLKQNSQVQSENLKSQDKEKIEQICERRLREAFDALQEVRRPIEAMAYADYLREISFNLKGQKAEFLSEMIVFPIEGCQTTAEYFEKMRQFVSQKEGNAQVYLKNQKDALHYGVVFKLGSLKTQQVIQEIYDFAKTIDPMPKGWLIDLMRLWCDQILPAIQDVQSRCEAPKQVEEDEINAWLDTLDEEVEELDDKSLDVEDLVEDKKEVEPKKLQLQAKLKADLKTRFKNDFSSYRSTMLAAIHTLALPEVLPTHCRKVSRKQIASYATRHALECLKAYGTMIETFPDKAGLFEEFLLAENLLLEQARTVRFLERRPHAKKIPHNTNDLCPDLKKRMCDKENALGSVYFRYPFTSETRFRVKPLALRHALNPVSCKEHYATIQERTVDVIEGVCDTLTPDHKRDEFIKELKKAKAPQAAEAPAERLSHKMEAARASLAKSAQVLQTYISRTPLHAPQKHALQNALKHLQALSQLPERFARFKGENFGFAHAKSTLVRAFYCLENLGSYLHPDDEGAVNNHDLNRTFSSPDVSARFTPETLSQIMELNVRKACENPYLNALRRDKGPEQEWLNLLNDLEDFARAENGFSFQAQNFSKLYASFEEKFLSLAPLFENIVSRI